MSTFLQSPGLQCKRDNSLKWWVGSNSIVRSSKVRRACAAMVCAEVSCLGPAGVASGDLHGASMGPWGSGAPTPSGADLPCRHCLISYIYLA